LPFVPLLTLKAFDDYEHMDTYSGDTKVELTIDGWLYLANIHIARAQHTTNPLEAAALLGRAKQKVVAQ
jgi:hypothetical protein